MKGAGKPRAFSYPAIPTEGRWQRLQTALGKSCLHPTPPEGAAYLTAKQTSKPRKGKQHAAFASRAYLVKGTLNAFGSFCYSSNLQFPSHTASVPKQQLRALKIRAPQTSCQHNKICFLLIRVCLCMFRELGLGAGGKGRRWQAEVPVFQLNCREHVIIIGILKHQNIFQKCFHSIATIIAIQSGGNSIFNNTWCSSLQENRYIRRLEEQ